MTNENMIKQLKRLIPSLSHGDDVNAVKGAIKALEQEPCDKCRYKRTSICGNCKEYDEFEPCDAISRDAAIEAVKQAIYNHDSAIMRLTELPSVTQKPETVTEFADRCRECGARYGKLLKQKSGKWILLDECANSGYYCSNCQKKLVKEGWSPTIKKIKYCPNCGAKMESEVNNG